MAWLQHPTPVSAAVVGNSFARDRGGREHERIDVEVIPAGVPILDGPGAFCTDLGPTAYMLRRRSTGERSSATCICGRESYDFQHRFQLG